MPVIGLTDRQGMFMEIGRIRKGGEKVNGNYGPNLDYFRVTFHPDEKEAAEIFKSVYGEMPRMINIRIAYPDIPRVWDANYEAHIKGGMVAQATGDASVGGKWRYYYDNETGTVHIKDYIAKDEVGEKLIAEGPHLDKPLPSSGKNPVMLKLTGKLMVVIPEIPTAAYFVAITHSIHDIAAISQELQGYQDMARTYNKTLCDIPFLLIRREEMITKKIEGKKVKMPDWMVHIVPSGEWTNRAMLTWNRLALEDIVDGETKLLPDPKPQEHWDDEEETEPDPDPEPVLAGRVTPEPVREEAKPEPNGQRPYAPEQFKKAVEKLVVDIERKYAESGLELSASDDERRVAASIIDKIYGGDKGLSRHVVCDWLFPGHGSVKEMTPAQVKALFHVMGVKNEPEHKATFNDPPSGNSIAEFRDAYQYVLSQQEK